MRRTAKKDNSISALPTQYDRTSQRYLHLLWFALGYGVIGLFLTAILFNGRSAEPIVFMPILAVIFSTVWLTALWTVMGSGSYLKRFFWSHLISILVVGTGLGLGSATIIAHDFGLDGDDFFKACVLIVLGIPAVSIAAQLPFWFFRLFFGWQLVFRKESLQESVTLRDGFVITFVFAFAFAAPQISYNFAVKNFGIPDVSSDVEQVTLADGSTSYERVQLTDQDKIEKRKKEMAIDMKMSVMFAYAVVAAYALVLSLLNLPLLFFMFRTHVTGIGCSLVAGYALAWFLFPILMVGILGDGDGPLFEEVSGYWATFLMCYGAGLSIPIAVSRSIGFRLSSPARELQKTGC